MSDERRDALPSNERSILRAQLRLAANFCDQRDCHVMGDACRKAAELLADETNEFHSWECRTCSVQFATPVCHCPSCRSVNIGKRFAQKTAGEPPHWRASR